jgi:hypothetical protein
VTITLPEKLFEVLGHPVPYLIEISAGETKEFGLALFLVVYAVSIAGALTQATTQQAGRHKPEAPQAPHHKRTSPVAGTTPRP